MFHLKKNATSGQKFVRFVRWKLRTVMKKFKDISTKNWTQSMKIIKSKQEIEIGMGIRWGWDGNRDVLGMGIGMGWRWRWRWGSDGDGDPISMGLRLSEYFPKFFPRGRRSVKWWGVLLWKMEGLSPRRGRDWSLPKGLEPLKSFLTRNQKSAQ